MNLLARLRSGSLLGGFVRDVGYLASGAAAAQIILLASQIVIARLYSPDERGTFSVAVGYASMLAVLATLRYEMAIPLAKGDSEARALLHLCVRSAVVVGLIAQVGVLLFADLGGVEGGSGAGVGLYLVPLTAVAISLFTTVRLFESRRGRFQAVGRAGVWGALVTAGSQIAAGVAGVTAAGLTAGYALGRLVNASTMSTRVGDLSEDRERLRVVARRWRRMPLLNSLPALLNVVSVGGVAPLVALLFGRSFAGQFGLAVQLLAAPAALLGQAVASAFFPKMARIEQDTAASRDAVLRTAAVLTLVALPVFVAVGVLGPEAFSLVFGPQWHEAGVLAAMLAPWLAANFVSSPLNSYATVRDRLGRILVVALVETAARLIGLWLGVAFGDPVFGVLCYGIAGFVICAYYVGWVLDLAGSSLAELGRTVRGPLLVGVVVVLASVAARAAAGQGVVMGVGVLGAVVLGVVAARQTLRLLRRSRTAR